MYKKPYWWFENTVTRIQLDNNKYNQKLINIVENQKIYGCFLKIPIFRVSLSEAIYKVNDQSLCKWVLESETRNTSILRKSP